MPRIKTKGRRTAPTVGWEQVIANQVRSGKVLPIISNRLHDDRVLGGHRALAEAFADFLGYPLEDKHDLSRVTLFSSVLKDVARAENVVKGDYLNFIKNRVFDQAEAQGLPRELLDEVEAQFDDLDFSALASQLGRPAFGQPGEDPLLILAQLDLPIYLTTSYHRFIEAALERAGRHPTTAVCRWRQELENLPNLPDPFDGDYQPSRENPLVYHLHGLDSYPESLVLTEDDHLAFLVAISRDPDLIPLRLRQALTDSSLMLLGYDLRDCDFRSLLWGLIKPRPVRQQSVCVLQIEPGDEEKRYLNRYLDEVDFKVNWGSFDDYARQLYQQFKP